MRSKEAIPWPPSDPAPFFEFNALGPIASQAASVSRFMASCVGCNNSWTKLGMLAHRFTPVGTWCTLLTYALCIFFAEWFLSGFFWCFLWGDMRMRRIKNLDKPTQNHATRNISCLWTLKTWTSSTRVTKETARTHNEKKHFPYAKWIKMDYSQKCRGNPW